MSCPLHQCSCSTKLAAIFWKEFGACHWQPDCCIRRTGAATALLSRLRAPEVLAASACCYKPFLWSLLLQQRRCSTQLFSMSWAMSKRCDFQLCCSSCAVTAATGQPSPCNGMAFEAATVLLLQRARMASMCCQWALRHLNNCNLSCGTPLLGSSADSFDSNDCKLLGCSLIAKPFELQTTACITVKTVPVSRQCNDAATLHVHCLPQGCCWSAELPGRCLLQRDCTLLPASAEVLF